MIITFNQMPTNISINNISGLTPFNVYLCDQSNVTCIYIDTIPSSSLPYNFQVPSIMENQPSYNVKVVDNNGCTSISNIILGPIPPTLFTSVWRTVSYLEPVTLPYVVSGTYSGTINWGDGTTDVNSYTNRVHTYDDPGDYTITIDGDLIGWKFNNTGSKSKIREIKSWGQFNDGALGRTFYGCNNLVLTGVTDIPTNLGNTMESFFNACTSITTVNNLNSWDVSNVTNMRGVFFNTPNFNQSISDWDVSNVNNMSAMFYNAANFNQPIGNWEVSGVTNMDELFYSCTNFNQPLSGWNVSNVTTMYGMFAYSPFNQPIGNWNVSGVTDMGEMFNNSTYFNQPLSGWDVSNVTYMASMFQSTPFNQPIGNWNVSGVTDMGVMFYQSQFNQPLSGWNVSNVTNMGIMFAYSQFNQPIGNWDVSNVIYMNSVFQGDYTFDQPLSGWNVYNVTDMGYMFAESSFNQPIGNWNVSGVTNMDGTFYSCGLFNQPLSGWNVSNVQQMNNMFMDSSFNQPIGNWNVVLLTSANYMLDNIPMSMVNYNNLLIGWASLGGLLQPSVTLGANTQHYTIATAGASRTYLTGTKLWNIVGDSGI